MISIILNLIRCFNVHTWLILVNVLYDIGKIGIPLLLNEYSINMN